ncbi:TPA: hypothetical protein IAC10_13630 [Candidatus Scatousia excrementigallinarum]|uniref:Uncharacterized protein n=1 Tax=Candidatus Scatousia excrementigallinarum TaxID=2840935 RepID=A0A9D1JP28_9BACT|nr:hypothetical protein [Candidatus Scatousia excrementigallinarum]
MGINEDLRIILLKECLTIKKLAEKASKQSGKQIKPESLVRKLNNGTMQYDEAQFYGDVLGYDLQFVKRQ